ncbi:mis6 domain-containing protein [Pyrenophora teres f. maculata]|nr:mis6 domain-containing protein [Pyrenophora teres f. maculata]
MPSVTDERPPLQETLNLLHQGECCYAAAQTTAKQRTIKVSSIVHVICRYALEDGLDQDALSEVVQLASVKTLLDQTTITTLIKNLYPAQKIPGHVVITVVGALGQGKGKPSPGTQDSLVKWLMTVHEIIEDPNVLSRLYGVLFGMLDMISIRLELSRGLSNEPALQGLLRVYKDYYPDIILGSTSTSRKSFAPRPDDEWRARITAVHANSTAADDSTADVQNGFKVRRKGPRGSKGSAIPDVHTYHATEASITLEGIDNVDDFVEKLDRIEPPGQLVSLLADSLLQKYVDLKPSPVATARIGIWLSTCLEEQHYAYSQGNRDDRYLSEILDGLLAWAQYTKSLHPTALAFLQKFLPLWDGQENLATILGLLSYAEIEEFEDFHTTYLSPVERALSAQGIPAYTELINFYTTLLQHQISNTSTLSVDHVATAQQVVRDLVTHVATLFTSALLSIPQDSSTRLKSAILSFYELLSTSSKPHVIPIILPPMHLVYLLTQDTSPVILSRICGIIGAYKSAFDAHPKPVKNYYPTAVTDAFNHCLRDMYNLVWVSRGLLAQDQKSQGLYCDPELRFGLNSYLNNLSREYSIGSAFTLCNNAWLVSLAAAAWREVEERKINEEDLDKSKVRYHQGLVSEKSLEILKRKGGVSVDWEGPSGFKVMVLQWLDERGMGGIRSLMFATVMNLKTTL